MNELLNNVELAIKEAIESGDEDLATDLAHIAYSLGVGLD